jgi:hypothetical protein
MASNIADNIAIINEKIDKAAKRSGRDPKEITLLAVTKTVEITSIRKAISAGVRLFGENYIQEAKEKIEKIRRSSVIWHFIGHLQRNKVKYAVELFDIIQTVDSFELAKEINKKAKRPIDILIEVNIAGEKTKAGVQKDRVIYLVRKISKLKNLSLKGLMTIPPIFDNPQLSRPYFVTLRRLAERVNRERINGVAMNTLSMGMSNDFEVAIEEGATILRIGTAIFGERPEKK